MVDKQRTFGQFETPIDLADLLLGFCLRHPTDRILDPGCGRGVLLQRAAQWQQWLAPSTTPGPPGRLWGVELDPDTAVSARARLPQATILTQNFFTLAPDPDRPFDAIIGNPPYTRAARIDRLRQQAQQLTFAWGKRTAEEPQALVPAPLWSQLSQRAGLHAYFFLHGLPFLREGGRFGFVVPNGWLDVAYGTDLKQFIWDNFRIIALIESSVERWFVQAKVNTCLVILEKCSGPRRRAQNQTRLVRLKRPLKALLPLPATDNRRPQRLEQLVTRLLPGHSRQTDAYEVQVVTQGEELAPAERWGRRLRAPQVCVRPRLQKPLSSLSDWASVRRGYTTGANEFFYLKPDRAAAWEIEPQFRQPMMKSLRGLDGLRLTPADSGHELLLLPATADLSGTAVAAYIAWGEAQQYHLRRTCAARPAWYALPPQQPARLVLPKGIWRRHSAPLLEPPLPVDQQLYQIRPVTGIDHEVAAALLNSSWFMLQCELNGRVNFGAGVLWLATYELEQIRLPDPRTFTAAQMTTLVERFRRLAERPCLDAEAELQQPDRQALDAALFDLMGFTAGERVEVHSSLRDRVRTRRRRAQG